MRGVLWKKKTCEPNVGRRGVTGGVGLIGGRSAALMVRKTETTLVLEHCVCRNDLDDFFQWPTLPSQLL